MKNFYIFSGLQEEILVQEHRAPRNFGEARSELGTWGIFEFFQY